MSTRSSLESAAGQNCAANSAGKSFKRIGNREAGKVLTAHKRLEYFQTILKLSQEEKRNYVNVSASFQHKLKNAFPDEDFDRVTIKIEPSPENFLDILLSTKKDNKDLPKSIRCKIHKNGKPFKLSEVETENAEITKDSLVGISGTATGFSFDESDRLSRISNLDPILLKNRNALLNRFDLLLEIAASENYRSR